MRSLRVAWSAAACVLVAAVLTIHQPSYGSDRPEKLSIERLTGAVTSGSVEHHYGDLSIAAGEKVERSLAVLEGTLELEAGSVLRGVTWIVNGDLILVGDARIEGTVHLVNGTVFQSHDAIMTGTLHRYRCECELETERFEMDQQVVFIRKVRPDALTLDIHGALGPANRVEYSSLYLGMKRGNPDNPRPHWRGHASLIVPFRDNNRGYLGFDAELLIPVGGHMGDFKLAAFKKTVTNDAWQLGRRENSAILHFSHTDFHDYYERTAVVVGGIVHPTELVTLSTDIYYDHSRSLETRSVPSLANNGRPLRDNPAVNRGEILGTVTTATIDTRDELFGPSSAWFGSIAVERGWSAPGSMEFTTMTLDVRRYNYLWKEITLDVRGRIFTTWDDLPRQRLQSLNGYGGVRGLHDIPFDDRRGDRMALLSTELRIPMPQVPIVQILYTNWQVLLFADMGMLRLDGSSEGAFEFLNAHNDAWGKSAGVGISGESFLPYLGFYVAQDLDRRNKRPRFIVRALKSF